MRSTSRLAGVLEIVYGLGDNQMRFRPLYDYEYYFVPSIGALGRRTDDDIGMEDHLLLAKWVAGVLCRYEMSR